MIQKVFAINQLSLFLVFLISGWIESSPDTFTFGFGGGPDGFEFRVQQLQDARLHDIPIIVMTADDDLSINVKMKNPLLVLRKPLQMSELMESISDSVSDEAS